MKKQELVDVIRSIEEEINKEWSDLNIRYGEDLDEDYDKEWVNALKAKNLSIELEDHFGGEDMGSSYYSVFSVTNLETGDINYFKIDGWYASYHGADIDAWNFEEVKKVPVQTYEWESVE